jgi:hypothetical protein
MHDTNIANFSIPNNSAENSKCGLTAHAHIKGLKAENKVCISTTSFLYSAMTRCLLQARGDDYFLIAQTTTFLIVYK